jgi:predicted Zn-dependent protease
VAAPAWAQVKLPDFGDPSSGALSPADDRALGEAFMREVRASLTVIDDPEIHDYVQQLGYRLAGAEAAQGMDFHFFAVADGTINAFAGPGGNIAVHSGLILTTEFESELASVMAHEIAHVTQRHIARAIQMADRSNIPALAGLIAAIVLGTQNPQAGQAAAAAVLGSSIQRQLDFSRANESEADRVGMALMAGSDYDPRAMPSFFEKLLTSSRYYRRPPEYLSTHPMTTNRIADTRARAESYPYRQHADSLGYHLVRAKLRAAAEPDPRKAVSYFEEIIKTGRYARLEAAVYGWGHALIRARQTDQAVEVLGKLAEQRPDRTSYRAALGQAHLAAGDVEQAVAIYRDGHGLFPDNKSLVQGYAAALIAAGEPADALRVIDDFGRLHGMDAAMYKLAAEAHGGVGNAAASQLALAEHYYANGQMERAIHQLRLAVKVRETDYYTGSKVAARLREFEQEQALRARR